MNQIDVYYRALTDWRTQTTAHRDCEKFNKALSRVTDESVDTIKVTRAECTVDEEWVRRIEEGLIHIEKAINEERQFIQSNGEVVPIEKVRNFSRESVEHLAKHSNLLTKKPEEGSDIIPDHLYTVERLNDYTVYENRFLYMLLCYLRDFITLRYNKILDITGRYEGELKIDKTVTVGKQKLTYSVYMRDERRDDAYLNEHNSAKQSIDRISLILKSVLAFLATPLMEYCAKVPMLKPPITKTNVLKMNNNFKGAVALYDYIIAYDKQGYSVEYVENELAPYREEVSHEISEAGAMLSFLTYEHGLGIESDLRAAYDEEEALRRAAETRKRQEEIELMKLRVSRSGEGIEEYALALEKQLRSLIRDNERIAVLEREVDELKAIEETLTSQAESFEAILAEAKAETLAQEQEFLARIKGMEEDFAKQLSDSAQAHEEELARLNKERGEEREALLEANRADNERNELEKNGLREELSLAMRELEAERGRLDAVSEEKRLTEAMLKATRAANGLMSDEDFTDRERFNELEKEYTAFMGFYEEQWAIVKKKVRKDALKDVTKKQKKLKNDSTDKGSAEKNVGKNQKGQTKITEEKLASDETKEQKGQDE